MSTRSRRLIAIVALPLILWAAGAFSLDRYGDRPVPQGRWDAIIVAGCRVEPNGMPSLALMRRTRRAVALWQEGYAPVVVFTGGVGAFPPSEAAAAAAYAASLGLPEDAAVLEERSTSTEENAIYASEILGPDARVLVVSDTYHVLRAERVFGRYFAETSGIGSVASPEVRVRGALREVLAVSWYTVRGRMSARPDQS